MTTTVKLQSLPFDSAKTYITATLFIVANILLPQLFHAIHLGGPTWLPIYFFTLVGAYRYGWRVGVITALLSPLSSALIFGMPHVAVLPVVVIKSILLALTAAYAAARFGRPTILILLGVVATYQTAGTMAEWLITQDLPQALQNLKTALPGLFLQITAAPLVLTLLGRQNR